MNTAVSSYLRKNTDYMYLVNEDAHTELLFNNSKLCSARAFRNHINESKYSDPCAVRFWKNKFNVDINKQHWDIMNITNESRLKELHWKILHNIYPTNILLKKLDLADSELCSLCGTDIDFIEHFFYRCDIIKRLWQYIERMVNMEFGTNVKLTEQIVLFGLVDKSVFKLSKDQLKELNKLIMIAKMCISKFRYGVPIDIVIMFEKETKLRT